jgi:hypothetical protein
MIDAKRLLSLCLTLSNLVLVILVLVIRLLLMLMLILCRRRTTEVTDIPIYIPRTHGSFGISGLFGLANLNFDTINRYIQHSTKEHSTSAGRLEHIIIIIIIALKYKKAFSSLIFSFYSLSLSLSTHNSTTLLLYYSTTLLLYYSTTLLQHSRSNTYQPLYIYLIYGPLRYTYLHIHNSRLRYGYSTDYSFHQAKCLSAY